MPEGVLHFLQALQHGSPYPLVFHTLLFALVFGVLFVLNIGLSRWPAARTYLLLAFSLFFYYKAGGAWVLLLCGTALVDYTIGLLMHRTQKQRTKDALLYTSVVVNLGVLAYFKYTLFFVKSWADVTGTEALVLNIMLPIGISYYTFRSLTYVLDLHRELIEAPERNYARYLLFVSFFPTLLAGPITRAIDFLPQLRQKLNLTNEQVGRAFFLFTLGFCKKVILADYLAANFTTRVLDAPGLFTGMEGYLALLGYGVQLYADFSGYTNMALGVALLLGIALPENFNRPFRATSVTDFWRRWHLTLSSWFNDYVFTPLNFSWRGLRYAGTAAAIVVTFLLSGLWHGASYSFVLWGLAHGLAIALEYLTTGVRTRLRTALGTRWGTPVMNFFGWILTLHFLLFTFALFRCATLTDAGTLLARIFTAFQGELFVRWLSEYAAPAGVLLLGLLLLVVPAGVKRVLQAHFIALPWPVQALLVALAVALAYQVRSADMQPFIYLQF